MGVAAGSGVAGVQRLMKRKGFHNVVPACWGVLTRGIVSSDASEERGPVSTVEGFRVVYHSAFYFVSRLQ